MGKGFSLAWTQGTPPERKKEVEDTIRNSTIALGQLRKIVQGEIDSLSQADILAPKEADNNYALRIAHHNGQRLFAQKILDLLGFMK